MGRATTPASLRVLGLPEVLADRCYAAVGSPSSQTTHETSKKVFLLPENEGQVSSRKKISVSLVFQMESRNWYHSIKKCKGKPKE